MALKTVAEEGFFTVWEMSEGLLCSQSISAHLRLSFLVQTMSDPRHRKEKEKQEGNQAGRALIE